MIGWNSGSWNTIPLQYLEHSPAKLMIATCRIRVIQQVKAAQKKGVLVVTDRKASDLSDHQMPYQIEHSKFCCSRPRTERTSRRTDAIRATQQLKAKPAGSSSHTSIRSVRFVRSPNFQDSWRCRQQSRTCRFLAGTQVLSSALRFSREMCTHALLACF